MVRDGDFFHCLVQQLFGCSSAGHGRFISVVCRESSSESGSTVIIDTPRPPPSRGGDPIMLDLDIPSSVANRVQRSPLQVNPDRITLFRLYHFFRITFPRASTHDLPRGNGCQIHLLARGQFERTDVLLHSCGLHSQSFLEDTSLRQLRYHVKAHSKFARCRRTWRRCWKAGGTALPPPTPPTATRTRRTMSHPSTTNRSITTN